MLLRNAFALLRKRRPTVLHVRRRAAFACLCAFLDSLAACQKGFFDTLQALTKSGQGFFLTYSPKNAMLFSVRIEKGANL